MQLILNLYSGRPNPSIDVDIEDVKIITEFIEELPPAKTFVFPAQPMLGYSGFTLMLEENLPLTMEFYKNFVHSVYNNQHEIFSIDDFGFEDFLKEIFVQEGNLTKKEKKLIWS